MCYHAQYLCLKYEYVLPCYSDISHKSLCHCHQDKFLYVMHSANIFWSPILDCDRAAVGHRETERHHTAHWPVERSAGCLHVPAEEDWARSVWTDKHHPERRHQVAHLLHHAEQVRTRQETKGGYYNVTILKSTFWSGVTLRARIVILQSWCHFLLRLLYHLILHFFYTVELYKSSWRCLCILVVMMWFLVFKESKSKIWEGHRGRDLCWFEAMVKCKTALLLWYLCANMCVCVCVCVSDSVICPCFKDHTSDF